MTENWDHGFSCTVPSQEVKDVAEQCNCFADIVLTSRDESMSLWCDVAEHASHATRALPDSHPEHVSRLRTVVSVGRRYGPNCWMDV